MGKRHEALVGAGTDQNLAREAAEEVANYDNRIGKVEADLVCHDTRDIVAGVRFLKTRSLCLKRNFDAWVQPVDQKAFGSPACFKVWFAQWRDLMLLSTMKRRPFFGLDQIS